MPASPIWAGLIAIADQGRVLEGGTPLTGYTQTLPALYSLPAADFHDILYGNNGDAAGPGYDLVTGLGTPVANLLVPALASYDLPSQIAITNAPPSSVVAGQTFGLNVEVSDALGNAINGGTVTIALANNPGGATLDGTRTVLVVDGLAIFSGLTLSQPGTGYTLTVTATGTSVEVTTGPITVTSAATPTQIVVTASPTTPIFDQAVTLSATVSVISPGSGFPTGAVTFDEGSTTLGTVDLNDGVASLATTPTGAGTQTITIDYQGDTNDQPSSVTFVLTVDPATPTLTWADPANIDAGTPLGTAQLDATASFNGTELAGLFVYTPAAGTVLPAGGGQNLRVSFQPADNADFTTVTASVPINVVPRSTPTPSPTPTPTPTPSPTSSPPPEVIVGEQALFDRKINKAGKPVGKAVLTGFSIHFDDGAQCIKRGKSRQLPGRAPRHQKGREARASTCCSRSRILPFLTALQPTRPPSSLPARTRFRAEDRSRF